MYEQINKIRDNKYILCSHLFMYAAALVYCLTIAFSGMDEESWEPWIIHVAVFLLMGLLEMLSSRSAAEFLEKKNVGFIYRLLRLVYVSVFYLMVFTITMTGAAIGVILIILSAVEMLLYIGFDQIVHRIIGYLIFAICFCVPSITIALSKLYHLDGSDSMIALHTVQEIMPVIVAVCSVVAIGELIAGGWTVFEKKLMEQNRTLDKLNDANDSMKEYQERIKHVNEKLGMQKIELRSANKKINRSHDEMSVQNEISSILAAALGNESMLQNITKIMQLRLDMDMVLIILEPDNTIDIPGEEKQGRYLAMTTCMGEEFEQEISDSVYKTELKDLLVLSQTYMQNEVSDTLHFFEYLSPDRELPSLICLPIVKQDVRLGTLVVGKNKGNAFMEGRAFYENIASQLSMGIANLRMYAQMNDMAIRDGLTRIYNRRHLTDLLNQYISDAVTKKMSVSLALFDIDKFKNFNDTYGHQCGDEVIRYIAALLNIWAVRNGGIAGRYGGEEFVIAFPDKDLAATYKIVEGVHNAIREGQVEYEGQVLSVRASAGVASYPETCSNPGELLTRADEAMYYSKRNGRDQITIDSEQINGTMRL